jgi:sarcosine/dimethylglycine N-methyltransferase
MSNINTAKLYYSNHRIWTQLAHETGNRGLRQSSHQIPVETVSKFDCYNYGGAEGAKTAAGTKYLRLSTDSKLLDVGAGLAGPARAIASYIGCEIVGVELQSDCAEIANELCSRTGLSEKINVICGDFLDSSVLEDDCGKFTAAMSWLVILHIPVSLRAALFAKLNSLLVSEGKVYIEDFYMLSPFTEAEEESLSTDVAVPNGKLPTRREYIETLENAGFEVNFEDVTDEWRHYVKTRCEAFTANKCEFEDVHGTETYRELSHFYGAVTTLFEGGNLGGVRMLLTKNADRANAASNMRDNM